MKLSLQDRLARMHRSVARRLSALAPVARYTNEASDHRPSLERLEERTLLSATLLVDAGVDQTEDEGTALSFAGTFEDTDTGGGTPGTFDVLQLTNTPANEGQLDIDGDRAVWTSNGDIFYYDGSTVNQVTSTPVGESDPHISGDHIVYAGGGIFAYNVNTGTTTTLAPSTILVANPEIDGDIAVWTQRPGGFFTVMMADLSSATPTPTVVKPIGSGTGANGNQLDPKVSGDNIIWLAPGVSGFNDVFVHNITTGITTNVSNTNFEDTAHQIDNGAVVFSGNGDVYAFDGRGFDGTGTAPVAVNIGTAGSDTVPQISGNNVVWDGNGDVYHYDLDTLVTTNLTNAPASFITEPSISGDNVVWSDSNEVFLYDLSGGTTTNLSNSAAFDSQAMVSGNNIVWLSRATFTSTNNDVFFASGQADPPTYTFDWDFGDGTVISDTTLAQSHTYADNGNYTVTLTVTASDGRVTSDTLTATIDNVAPTVDPIVGPTEGLRGSTFSFTGSFSDPGTADTHTTEWAVTDASSAVIATGTGTSFYFTPEDDGVFTVTFTVTDDDGGVGDATLATESKIVLVANGELQVAGSNGRDIIHITKAHGTPDALKVIVHELHPSRTTIVDDITGINRIIADGRGGDDQVKVFSFIDIDAELYGGDGDDWVRGGGGNDYVSGGDGNDLLGGGSGRDFLVGGLGSDLALGNNNDDILIGGVYGDDGDTNAIRAVLAEWTRMDLDYADRVDNLMNGTGLNGSFVINDTTVFDDGDADILLGMQGIDWFHAGDYDHTDQRRNELLMESEIDFVDVDNELVV